MKKNRQNPRRANQDLLVLKREREASPTISRKRQKLSFVDVKGDGNCFYRAISYALTSTEDNYPFVKEAALDFIRLHAHHLDEEDRRILIQENSPANAWSDDLMILNTAYALSIEIIVTSESYAETQKFGNDDEKPIAVVYLVMSTKTISWSIRGPVAYQVSIRKAKKSKTSQWTLRSYVLNTRLRTKSMWTMKLGSHDIKRFSTICLKR